MIAQQILFKYNRRNDQYPYELHVGLVTQNTGDNRGLSPALTSQCQTREFPLLLTFSHWQDRYLLEGFQAEWPSASRFGLFLGSSLGSVHITKLSSAGLCQRCCSNKNMTLKPMDPPRHGNNMAESPRSGCETQRIRGFGVVFLLATQ